MAFPAIHNDVFSFKGKVGQAMVKTRHAHSLERLLIVALHTIRSKFCIVDILMAGIAVVSVDAQAVLENPFGQGVHIVASGTIYPVMCSFQLEIRLAMVKVFYSGQ